MTKAPSQGVRTNCFRKEQAVTGLPRSARGCQAEEVRSGCGSEQMGLPDPDSPFVGMTVAGVVYGGGTHQPVQSTFYLQISQ